MVVYRIFWIHAANLLVWMVNYIELNELVTGFSFAIPAVLANRMLISIREQATVNVFPPGETELSKQSRMSWRAAPQAGRYGLGIRGQNDTTTFGTSTMGVTTGGYTTTTTGEDGQPLSGSSNSGTAVDIDDISEETRSERGSSKV
jgi:hypothetical protein